MHEDEMKGKWTQFKGDVQRQWGKLTNDDLDVVAGDSKKLAGKIQERYGKGKDEAEREVNSWIEGRKE
ncbi:MAG: CsbD family protein [Beijerinckiaceae bacterium]